MRTLLLAVLASTCAPPLALEGAPCPCVTGWTCCEFAAVCVRDGATCPTVPGPTVSTTAIELGQDRIHHFTSPSPDVLWSIDEGDAGGTIDQSGRYRAPWSVGTYHLTARAGGGVTRITITVRPLKLATLAGSSGGTSRIPVDGVKDLARLSRPSELVATPDALYFLDQVSTYNVLRRVTLATSEVETLIDFDDHPLPGQGISRGMAGLTSTGVSLLFIEGTNGIACAREYFPARDAIDTFWCGQSLSAITGDRTRLVRLGGQPKRLVVIDRLTRQEVELPAPPMGWVNTSSLTLFGQTLWVLTNGGAELQIYDLDRPTALPITVLAPTNDRFIDLSVTNDQFGVPGIYGFALTSTGEVRGFDVTGQQVSLRWLLLSPVAFAVDPLGSDSYFLLTRDSIRSTSSPVDELVAGKPAADRLEVDGVGGEARLVIPSEPKVAVRGDVVWLASATRLRRIARDGTTTSVSTQGVFPIDFTANDSHLFLYGSDALLRRAPIGGGGWETLPFEPAPSFAFLGALVDGRVAFIENGAVGFLDAKTGAVSPTRIQLPRLTNLALDPAGGVFGELPDEMGVRLPDNPLSGVQHFDFQTEKLTRVGPPAQNVILNGFAKPTTVLAAATVERQYALSELKEQVFVNDGMAWKPFVGQLRTPTIATGPLPGRVNTIGAIKTYENGDVLLFDSYENVVLVVR